MIPYFSFGRLPTEQILTIPREKALRIIFLPTILTHRESIGADWREKLPGFSVGIIEFIKTTPRYQPLPVRIYEDYSDGWRILDKMVAIGKFERIQLFPINDELIVVKNRANL